MPEVTTDTSGLAVTPYRKTHVRFDINQIVSVQAPFSMFRAGSEIARGNLNAQNSQNVFRLADGGITLLPLQEQGGQLHETTAGQAAIVRAAQMTLAPGFVERNTWRSPTDLSGLLMAPGVASTGDPYIVKTVQSGNSWVANLATDITSWGQPAQAAQSNVPIHRVAVGAQAFAGDQSYQYAFNTPGRALHPTDILGSFSFGNALVTDASSPYYGNGAYLLWFLGDGEVFLYEKSGKTTGAMPTDNFVIRDRWRYAPAGRVGNLSVAMRIHCYYRPDGTGKIEFRSETSSHAAPIAGGLLFSAYGSGSSPTTHTYTVNRKIPTAPTPGTPLVTPPPPKQITGPGPFRVDQRADLRFPFQVSKLMYATSGYVIDFPLSIGDYGFKSGNLTLLIEGTTPAGTTITGKLYDAGNGVELTQVSFGPGYAVYQTNPQQPHYYAAFFLTGDGTNTPVMWRYRVYRDGALELISPGEFDTAANTNSALLQTVNISGPEADPSHETAAVAIEDPAAEMNFLAGRSRIRMRIETEHKAGDTSLRSILFDGYAQRSVNKRKGSATGKAFPSALWRRFEVTANGMWQALEETLAPERLYLGSDPNAATPAPYKVTDICRVLLSYAGFTPGMIDIPDSPIRFFPSGRESGEELLVDPLSNVAEQVTRFLKDYLGWFLIWNGNAGASGMWQARAGAKSPYTNLAYFTTGDSVAGKLVSRPGTYGTPDWVTKDNGTLPRGFIRKKTLEKWVKPPEANYVRVTGPGDILPNRDGSELLSNWAANPKSYDCFTDTAGNVVHTAFPTNDDGSVNTDYIGRQIPIFIVDHSISDQTTCDVLTRRYYDLTCHSIQMWGFEAPLLLVNDPNDPNQVNPRPLRYYDPVLIYDNGTTYQVLIRNVNPIYRKDHVQMARYEAEGPRI